MTTADLLCAARAVTPPAAARAPPATTRPLEATAQA